MLKSAEIQARGARGVELGCSIRWFLATPPAVGKDSVLNMI